MKKYSFAAVLIVASMWWSAAIAMPVIDPTVNPVNECEIDADCPALFTCKVVQQSDCPPSVGCPSCECPPCLEDAGEGCACVCPVCDVVENPADCGGTVEYKVCEWTPVTCEADVDCADGFECTAQESCSSSGCVCPTCVCAEPVDGGEWFDCDCPEAYSCDCGDVSEPVCEVTARYCLPKEVACQADVDCADGFFCVATGAATSCACPDCLCPACADGAVCEPCQCDVCDCDTAVSTEKVCLPAGWADYINDGLIPVYEGSETGVTDSGATRSDDLGEVALTDVDAAANSCQTGNSSALPGILVIMILGMVVVLRRRAF